MCRTGLATLPIFYCDFRDKNKQNTRNLLSSILIQLCHQSDAFSQVLSSVYSTHGDGSQQPSIGALQECLKRVLDLPGQGAVYLVVDARAEHRTVYGIRPYPYGANTVTGTPVTVTVQWPENAETVRYGCEYGRIRGHTGLYGCD